MNNEDVLSLVKDRVFKIKSLCEAHPSEENFKALSEQELIQSALEKQFVYEPKDVRIGCIRAKQCKCGAYFVDTDFDGYCGKCGQRLKWDE